MCHVRKSIFHGQAVYSQIHVIDTACAGIVETHCGKLCPCRGGKEPGVLRYFGRPGRKLQIGILPNGDHSGPVPRIVGNDHISVSCEAVPGYGPAIDIILTIEGHLVKNAAEDPIVRRAKGDRPVREDEPDRCPARIEIRGADTSGKICLPADIPCAAVHHDQPVLACYCDPAVDTADKVYVIRQIEASVRQSDRPAKIQIRREALLPAGSPRVERDKIPFPLFAVLKEIVASAQRNDQVVFLIKGQSITGQKRGIHESLSDRFPLSACQVIDIEVSAVFIAGVFCQHCGISAVFGNCALDQLIIGLIESPEVIEDFACFDICDPNRPVRFIH